MLEKVTFDKLEILDLRWNKIVDINFLEFVNSKQPTQLYLPSNNISDIKVLEKVKSDKLEIRY